jgi:L-cystine uptake protein TcyP (sodium:dicarboxylate symporter family)
MVAISVVVGIILGIVFGVGAGHTVQEGTAQAKAITPLYGTLRALLPNNPVQAMVGLNVIAIVIFAAFLGLGAKRMSKKYMDVVKPFFDLIHALHKIIMSIAMTIVKLMPYAVIPLLASTIATRGMSAILEVGKFILVLYLGMAIMFIIQMLALAFFKINPIYYLKKSVHVMLLAFTSRSSVGCLPVTIDNLTNRLGVNSGTANFVASFGSTAGMQGCAGVFPALLIVFVSNMAGVPIDITLIVMAVIVISIGSLGIAGIPGTATMAASVALSGVGMSSLFNLISPIIAIDPLIDMGRTMLNVTGATTNALMVDQTLGQLDHKVYADMNVAEGISMDD